MDNLSISKAIRPYFNHYIRKYTPDTSEKGEIITIPMKDGSRALDTYFIKPLLDNGFIWHDSFLLGEIYLTRTIQARNTAASVTDARTPTNRI